MSGEGPGRLGRREMLGLMAAGALARGASAAPFALHATMIDHVEFWVSDVGNSTTFYSRVFGRTVLKNNKTPRRYVKLGPSFVAMDRGPQIRVDHFCAGISDFQIAAAHRYLEERGLTYKDYPSGRDLYVVDPDGIHVQLSGESSWNQLLAGTASPETPPGGEPVFQALGLDHILLHVTDPEKSAAFYEQIFGPVAQRNNNRTWFRAGRSRIGLLRTPAGGRAGVDHFCVAAAPFDYDAAAKKLAEAGAKIEKPEIAGAPEFRDPDGYLVQVMAQRA
ncbi:MAG TPA: VOC family protein [Bryobacteraceae bacterium]|nr:VOC family protein [Bryobacteraceae bacterium]